MLESIPHQPLDTWDVDTEAATPSAEFMVDRLAPLWSGGEPVRPGDSVTKTIARFHPKAVDDALWSRIGPVIKPWAQLAAPSTPYNARTLLSILTQLARWGDRIGLPLDAESLLHPDVLDRFVTEGLDGYASGTALNYRRHLRCVGEAVLGPAVYPPRPLAIHRENVLAPYTRAEITSLRAWGGALPTERFRHTAQGIIVLGLGAGLTSQEQSRLIGSEITRDADGVLVQVVGSSPRSVPVLWDFEDAVARLGRQAGHGPVLMPERTRITRHQLKNFVARCPAGDAPVLDTGRLRATWICRQLTSGTRIDAVEAASGVKAAQLVKYREYVPKLDPATARRLLREAGRP